jgi:hypothetical protein
VNIRMRSLMHFLTNAFSSLLILFSPWLTFKAVVSLFSQVFNSMFWDVSAVSSLSVHPSVTKPKGTACPHTRGAHGSQDRVCGK